MPVRVPKAPPRKIGTVVLRRRTVTNLGVIVAVGDPAHWSGHRARIRVEFEWGPGGWMSPDCVWDFEAVVTTALLRRDALSAAGATPRAMADQNIRIDRLLARRDLVRKSLLPRWGL
jgi:hypothetical protein